MYGWSRKYVQKMGGEEQKVTIGYKKYIYVHTQTDAVTKGR